MARGNQRRIIAAESFHSRYPNHLKKKIITEDSLFSIIYSTENNGHFFNLLWELNGTITLSIFVIEGTRDQHSMDVLLQQQRKAMPPKTEDNFLLHSILTSETSIILNQKYIPYILEYLSETLSSHALSWIIQDQLIYATFYLFSYVKLEIYRLKWEWCSPMQDGWLRQARTLIPSRFHILGKLFASLMLFFRGVSLTKSSIFILGLVLEPRLWTTSLSQTTTQFQI